jgi:hypothetical protein
LPFSDTLAKFPVKKAMPYLPTQFISGSPVEITPCGAKNAASYFEELQKPCSPGEKQGVVIQSWHPLWQEFTVDTWN